VVTREIAYRATTLGCKKSYYARAKGGRKLGQPSHRGVITNIGERIERQQIEQVGVVAQQVRRSGEGCRYSWSELLFEHRKGRAAYSNSSECRVEVLRIVVGREPEVNNRLSDRRSTEPQHRPPKKSVDRSHSGQ